MCVDGYILKFKEIRGPYVNLMYPFLPSQRNKAEREVNERSYSLIFEEEYEVKNGDIDLSQLTHNKSEIFKIKTKTISQVESDDESELSPEQKKDKWLRRIEDLDEEDNKDGNLLLEKF